MSMNHSTEFTWISAVGAEARDFFQSQFSGDMKPLQERQSLFTGYCQPQGRVISTLLVACIHQSADEEEWALVLPQSIAEHTLNRLQKFVMRRKVKMALTSYKVARLDTQPTDCVHYFQDEGQFWGAFEGDSAEKQMTTTISCEKEQSAGRVWIVPATSEQFIPQMINLEQQGGISFNKGCYPGQEVVARLHYLGKPKRGLYHAQLSVLSPTNEVSSDWVGSKAVSENQSEVGLLVALSAPSSLDEKWQGLFVLSHQNATDVKHLLSAAGQNVAQLLAVKAHQSV